MDRFKETRKKHTGIGGFKCNCCNYYIGDRKRERRATRRRVNDWDNKNTLLEEGEDLSQNYYPKEEDWKEDLDKYQGENRDEDWEEDLKDWQEYWGRDEDEYYIDFFLDY